MEQSNHPLADRPDPIVRDDISYIILRADLLEIFEWRKPMAFVCQVFLNWEVWKKRWMIKHGFQGLPWVDLSIEDIRNGCLGAVSASTIEKCVKELVELGIVKMRDTGRMGEKRSFLVDIDRINALIQAVPANVPVADPRPTPARRNSYLAGIGSASDQQTSDSEQIDSPQNYDDRPYFYEPPSVILRTQPRPYFYGLQINTIGSTNNNNQSTLPPASTEPLEPSREVEGEYEASHPSLCGLEIPNTSECTEGFKQERRKSSSRLPGNVVAEESSPTHPQSPLPQTPPKHPTNSLSRTEGAARDDAGDTMDFKWFSRAYLRCCRKAKKPTGMDKKRVEEFLDSTQLSGTYLTECLEGFGESDWAREHGYPVAAFLKDPAGYHNGHARAASAVAVALSGGRATSDTPETLIGRSSASTWDAATAWNEKVQHAPKVALSIQRNASYTAVTRDLDFRERFNQLAEKCDRLHEACGADVNWLTFPWLLRTKDGNDLANWQLVLDGRFDWKLERKTVTGDRMEAALEKVRREFYAQLKTA